MINFIQGNVPYCLVIYGLAVVPERFWWGHLTIIIIALVPHLIILLSVITLLLLLHSSSLWVVLALTRIIRSIWLSHDVISDSAVDISKHVRHSSTILELGLLVESLLLLLLLLLVHQLRIVEVLLLVMHSWIWRRVVWTLHLSLACRLMLLLV